MADEATKTPLDDSKDRLREAKDERKIAKDHLSKAKQDLVEVRREYPEKIATAKNALWHARETLRAIRKDRKYLAGLRRTLHRQRRRTKLRGAKLDARLEEDAGRRTEDRGTNPKAHGTARKGDSGGPGAVDAAPPAKNQDRISRTTFGSGTARLGKGTGRVDASRKRIEDELKDVKNQIEDREQQEQGAIKDVDRERKELDALTDARRGKETQEERRIRHAWETALKKRRAVWIAASRVNSEALKFPWKRVADNIRRFGRYAGFAGVAGCFYAYAVSLGAIYQYFYFDSIGINIFSYAESIDFLAPGYGLAAFFILTTGLVTLIPLVFYHLVKLILILPLPLYAEILAAVLPHFAKWVPKTSLFVLYCAVWLLFWLLVAAPLGYIWPPSQDVVWIVTDAPFQNEEKYVRVGSTSKYLFLKKFDESKEAGGEPTSNSDTGILIVPLSQITCISETTGNGEGLCRPAAVKSPPPAEDPVDQHIANDMGCCPGKLDKSIFFSFVHDKGQVMDESQEQKPKLKDVWEKEIGDFVEDWNGKAAKWRVYGFASLDGRSADNDDLSLERAETLRTMLCTASKIWSSREKCQEEVEIRYLGENHLVTAGLKSQSAVVAVCERVPEQNPEKTTTPARKAGALGV